jgi:hypothetical protein
MNSIFEKLGQNPQRSLQLFMRGLGLFVIGVFFIFIGYYFHYYWQIVGLFFLVPAVLLSAYGYIGIFINRLLNILQRKKP